MQIPAGWIQIAPGVWASPAAANAANRPSQNNQQSAAERERERRRREEEAERLRQQQIQREERERVATEQVATMQELQSQYAAQSAANAALAYEKREEFEGQRAELAAQQVNNLAAGRAVGSSLRILSAPKTRQGRGAALSRRGRRSGGARTTTSSLSIGNTGRGSGSGSNLSI